MNLSEDLQEVREPATGILTDGWCNRAMTRERSAWDTFKDQERSPACFSRENMGIVIGDKDREVMGPDQLCPQRTRLLLWMIHKDARGISVSSDMI